MAAAILGDSPTTIRLVPKLKDIYTFNNVIRVTGTSVQFDEENNTLTIDSQNLGFAEAPYELVRKMRASFYMLGALMGKTGEAKVSLPGGCAWGPRPVNLHLRGMEALGATIDLEGGYIHAKADRLRGADISFEISSVGATANVLMAAVLAEGRTVLDNAAREPEVTQLAQALVAAGAKIDGIGTTRLEVTGVHELSPLQIGALPDRIEVAGFL